jgi:hypothetical protein
MPAGEVGLVTVKALLPTELAYLLEHGKKGRDELLRRFDQQGEVQQRSRPRVLTVRAVAVPSGAHQSGRHANGESGQGCRHWNPGAHTEGGPGLQLGRHCQPSQTFPEPQAG